MELTEHGLKKPDNDDFYNIQDFNENTTVIEAHLSDKENHVISSEIADIVEPGALTKIGSGDNNSTIWGKIKKAISVLLDHIGNVATATTTGHIKIGTGLQMSSGTASVKIANNLTTNDSTTALSAAMGTELNTNLLKIFIGTVTTASLTPNISGQSYWITLSSLPSYNQILTIIPLGYQPANTYDSELHFRQSDIANRRIEIYVKGTYTQYYSIHYLILYK